MLSRLSKRLGLRSLAAPLLDEQVPARGRWSFTLGSATLTAFGLQAVSGVAMLFFYEPTVAGAHASIVALMREVPLGSLIRSLHFWGASAMVLLLLLHLSRVYFSASYKHPREPTWVLGVLLFFFTLNQFYSGNLLGFHEFGYWSAVVGTYMLKYVPLVGQGLYEVATGGEFVGQATLTRFFLVHALIFPVLLAGIAAFHLRQVIRLGEFGWWFNYREFLSGAPDPAVRGQPFGPGSALESVRFYPHQALRDATTSLLLVATLFGLALAAPAPLFAQADPGTLSFIPRAQWVFLPLQRFLDFMPGSALTALGSWVFILVLVSALIWLPFLDRDLERNPLRRPAMSLLGVIAILLFGMLLIIELMQDPALGETVRSLRDVRGF